VQLEHVRLTLQRLGGVPGDERVIFRAHLPLPPDDFDPERDGASVQVLDAEDPFGFGMNGVLELSPLGLFGVAIPPAAPASGCGGPADGWRPAGGLPRAVYRNVSGQWLGYGTPPICFPMPARGNVEAVVDDRRARGRAVRIRVETRGSTIGFPAEPMRATVSLGATLGPGHAGRCGLWVSERCTTSGDGSTMRCR
jgi:hypothetical protein